MPAAHNACSKTTAARSQTVTIADRMKSLEDRQKDTQRKMEELLNFLGINGDGVRSSHDAMIAECKEIKNEMFALIVQSKHSQDTVVRKTGVKLVELKNYADDVTRRAIEESKQAAETMKDELKPIKDAVGEFRALEDRMTRMFNGHSANVERMVKDAAKCMGDVRRFRDEVEDSNLGMTVDQLKLDYDALKAHVTTLERKVRRVSMQESVEKLEASVATSRSELTTLAENIAKNIGAPDEHPKMTQAEWVANSQKASKLLKTRPQSAPPPRSRSSSASCSFVEASSGDCEKWRQLLTEVTHRPSEWNTA